MTKPKKEKPKSQKTRFIETARELECDESDEAFEKTFEKIVPPKKSGETPESDPKA